MKISLSALTYDEIAKGFSYDPASQVTSILHQLQATSSQVNKAEYLYNPVGNRTSLTDKRGAQSFGYDTLDRLTSASHPLLGTPQSFAYDPVGNRTTGGSVEQGGRESFMQSMKRTGRVFWSIRPAACKSTMEGLIYSSLVMCYE